MVSLKNFWLWLRAEYQWRVRGKRYEIRFSEEAQSQMDALPQDEQDEIMKAMERLTRNPYSGRRVELTEDEDDTITELMARRVRDLEEE